MKSLPLILLSMSLMLLPGCATETEDPVGKWEAVKVNRDSWAVTGAGEDITVKLLNYSSWWIGAAYEDPGDYDNYVWPSLSSEQYAADILDGGWFYARVPHDGNAPRLEIWVGANESGTERDAYIDMSCGDVGKTIHVHQKMQEGHVIVEWARSGWDDVVSDLPDPVTVLTLYTEDPDDPWNEGATPHEIAPGGSVRLDVGAFIPGESIRERPFMQLTLSDGREFMLSQSGEEEWNRIFYDSFTEETVRERVDAGGIWTNHIYTTRVYRITPQLVALLNES